MATVGNDDKDKDDEDNDDNDNNDDDICIGGGQRQLSMALTVVDDRCGSHGQGQTMTATATAVGTWLMTNATTKVGNIMGPPGDDENGVTTANQGLIMLFFFSNLTKDIAIMSAWCLLPTLSLYQGDYGRGCIDKILGRNISPKIKCKVWILQI